MANGYRRLGRNSNPLLFSRNVSLFGIIVILVTFIALFYLYLNAKSNLETVKKEASDYHDYITRLKSELLEKNAKFEELQASREECNLSKSRLDTSYNDCLKDLKLRNLNEQKTIRSQKDELEFLRKLKMEQISTIVALNETVDRMKLTIENCNEKANETQKQSTNNANTLILNKLNVNKLLKNLSTTTTTELKQEQQRSLKEQQQQDQPLKSQNTEVKEDIADKVVGSGPFMLASDDVFNKPALPKAENAPYIADNNKLKNVSAAVVLDKLKKEANEIHDAEDFAEGRQRGGRLRLGEKSVNVNGGKELLNAAASANQNVHLNANVGAEVEMRDYSRNGANAH